MGNSVSSGRDNDELIDNLIDNDLITTKQTENVFRAVDRGNYLLPSHRKAAYQDSAWRADKIHLSAPSIYCKVVEGLELKPGLSFLNLGGGTGYLSTMIGLIIGACSVNHAVEYHTNVIQYAVEKLEEFIMTCQSFDEFDFCPPQFIHGNVLKISAVTNKYDRVYCGADCPKESLDYIKNLLKLYGIAIVPCDSQLMKITRTGEDSYTEKGILPVSFSELIAPTADDDIIDLPEFDVRSLKESCRGKIRCLIRKNIHIYKGDLDVRRKKGPSERTEPRGFTQTMSQYLTRLHTVGDNIHVIQVPDPGGDGEMGGFHNVPDDAEHVGVGMGQVELYAPDSDAEEPRVSAADGGNTAASSQHTDSHASVGMQLTSTQPMATPSRPIASSSAVRITTSRSISDGADSGFGTSVSSNTPTDRLTASCDPESLDSEPASSSLPLPDHIAETQRLLPDALDTVQEVLMDTTESEPSTSSHHCDTTAPVTVEPSATGGLSSPKRRLEDETEDSSSSSGDEKRPSFCGCCTSRQSAAVNYSSTSQSVVECQCTGTSTTTRQDEEQTHTEAEQRPPDHNEEAIDSSDDSQSDNDMGEEEEDVEGLGEEDMEARFRRRRQVLRSLMSVLDGPDQLNPPTEEEDEERLHNRNKAKLYHSSFASEMNLRINTLPIPPPLKDYLLYYRNNPPKQVNTATAPAVNE